MLRLKVIWTASRSRSEQVLTRQLRSVADIQGTNAAAGRSELISWKFARKRSAHRARSGSANRSSALWCR